MPPMDDFTPDDLRRLAGVLGRNPRFLWQCLTGRRALNAKAAVEAERITGGELRRWHLRPLDWHQVWPELLGAEGAPPAPAESADQMTRQALAEVPHA